MLVAIQEHWLFQFEQTYINDFHPDFRAASKHIDQDNPIQPSHKPRGYGGVAWFWHQSLDSSIRVLPDGGKQILAIELTTEKSPICLLCVYMPSRGNKEADEKYEAVLDEIWEILEKYASSHDIILLGDLNTAIFRPTPEAREKLLIQLLDNFNLITSQDQNASTFFHENNRDRSTIDYIFVKASQGLNCSDTTVLELDPTNTSDHTSVGMNIELNIKKSAKTPQHPILVNPKVNWAKCDLKVYRDTIREGLHSIQQLTESNTSAELLWTVHQLNDIMTRAGEEATGKKTSKRKKSKKGQKLWNNKISKAVAESKKAHWEWKSAGSPLDPQNILMSNRKQCKKNIRREQNAAIWSMLTNLYQEIADSSKNDNKLFHCLINKQRRSPSSTINELKVNGRICSTTEEICVGFGEHFASLAIPAENVKFDPVYQQQMTVDNVIIQYLCESYPSAISPTSETEIRKVIKSLNSNKAADSSGITAEHLKYANEYLAPVIANIVNSIFNKKIIPPIMKEGVLSPIEKKGKDKFIADNHRGITVLAILQKVLEQVYATRLCEILDPSQNEMQRGFTSESSSINAALLVSEAHNECADNKKTLYFTTLALQKHLTWFFINLYSESCIWMGLEVTCCSCYRNAETKIKWKGQYSKPITIKQGVRQGSPLSTILYRSPLSTILYKRFVNPLLNILQDSNLGFSWGSISCPAPTCADDVALLAQSGNQEQTMLCLVDNYTIKDIYQINPTKSTTIRFGPKKNGTQNCMLDFTLSGEVIPTTNTATHLGIERNYENSSTETISNNITVSRRSLYE